MKIDRIEIQKNNTEKANVYIDGKYSFSLSINGLLESGMHEGDEISSERLEEIKSSDAPRLALLKATDIISHSMKTESEITRKLKEKKFDDDAVEYAISKLKEYGYVDDEAYVAAYISSRAIPNCWGEQKIISMLIKKGIDKSIIKNKLEECLPEEVRESNILEAAEKYVQRLDKYDKKKKRQKLYQYLASKGYGYDVIKKTCSKILEEEYYED